MKKENIENECEQRNKIVLYKTPVDYVILNRFLYFNNKDQIPLFEKVTTIEGTIPSSFYDWQIFNDDKIYYQHNTNGPIIMNFDKSYVRILPEICLSTKGRKKQISCEYLGNNKIVLIPNEQKLIIFYDITKQKIINTKSFPNVVVYQIFKLNNNTIIILLKEENFLFLYFYDISSFTITNKLKIDHAIKAYRTQILKFGEEYLFVKFDNLFYILNWKTKSILNSYIYENNYQGSRYPFVAVDIDKGQFYEYPFVNLPNNKEKIKILHLFQPLMLFDFSLFDLLHYIVSICNKENLTLYLYSARFLFLIYVEQIFVFDIQTKLIIWNDYILLLHEIKFSENYIIFLSSITSEVWKIINKNLLSMV